MCADQRTKSEKRLVAEQLSALYHAAIRNETSRVRSTLTSTSKKHSYQLQVTEFDDLDKSARRAFLAAARVCIEEGADPRDWIVAQFAAMRSASAYHNKIIWAAPQQLSTLAARVRYHQHQASVSIRGTRKPPPVEDKDVRRRFFVEERELKGLARMQRRDTTDVLTEMPERFSREFLKHKGVWNVVSDIWEDRRS